MKYLMKGLLVVGLATIFFGCQPGTENKQEEAAEAQNDTVAKETGGQEEMISMEKDGITVVETKEAPEFQDAKITLESPERESIVEPGKNKFKFSVSNYELGNQTGGELPELCANSEKGQHIHFIVNNRPYEAYYESEFESEMEEGNNVTLAFLSRSYHMSIKTKDAHILTQFPTAKDVKKENLEAQHLFYSRPKGTYLGEDTKNILLDFFLVNTDLSEDGNKIKLTVNGTDFTINKWAPYFVKGLPMGDNTFRIQLLDKDGNPVPGPFNDSGERTITLKELPLGDKAG